MIPSGSAFLSCNAMKALIVEDEPRAQRVLEHLLRDGFPEIEIIGLTASVKETLGWLSRNKADVIFMDVELQDGNCFDIFAAGPVDAQVVMTTAYDNYAVKAFEVGSVDYLLKPIDREDLARAIARVRERRDAPTGIDYEKVLEAFRNLQKAEDLPSEAEAPRGQFREKFLIRLNDRIVPVHVRDIAYFFSESKNSYIVTKGNVTYVLDDSLDTIEGALPPKAFFRISRGAIVSEDVIESASRLLGGRLRLTLKRGIDAETDLTVSRSRADAFLQWLEA